MTVADRQGTQAPSRALGLSYHKLFWASVVSNVGDGVSTIAYPWLASAVTRNPLLVALVLVAQRLPWLVFTLPAGVITDRSAPLGGATVVIVSTFASREWALRSTWLLSAAIHVGLFIFGRAKLTTEKIEAARAAGASQSAS